MAIVASLTRDYLQTLRVDAVCYGAKDTGEMGGGAAAAILRAAGPQVLEAVRARLSVSARRIGDVVVTDAFGLHSIGVRWICHIISIKKDTPEGAYCPNPERLYDGVLNALNTMLDHGAKSIALSALGTGEGRVKPDEAARLMLTATRDFQKKAASRDLKIIFSLPTFHDYEAFASTLGRL